jgi:hypothetical protein
MEAIMERTKDEEMEREELGKGWKGKVGRGQTQKRLSRVGGCRHPDLELPLLWLVRPSFIERWKPPPQPLITPY